MAQDSIGEEDVRRIAVLARLSLPEAKIPELKESLGAMLEYVKVLEGLDTDGVEATTHPVNPSLPMRADKVVSGVDREEALGQAPASRDGGFAVPKVLEVEG
jgi:aspartyl-tRNA(Asn)/glutamyl-tRNA(Gln) amidotransferase subunit C